MEYALTKDAPLIIQIWREATSKQTLMFLVVVVLLTLAAYQVLTIGSFGDIATPFMLVIGYFFGESTVLASALQSRDKTARFLPQMVQPNPPPHEKNDG